MRTFLLVALLLIGGAFATNASTMVSGGIFSNTTWTKANSPYIVTDTVVVFPGVTLTIQPGVTIQFAASKQLEVRSGKIIAIGTAVDSIIFTSLSPAGPATWGSVYINNLNPIGVGPFYRQSFAYCRFSYATHGLQLLSRDTVSVHHSLFQYNQSGIHGNGTTSGATCALDSCTFSYNVAGVGSFDYNNNYGNYLSAAPMTNCVFAYNQQVGAILRFGRASNCSFKHNTIGVWSRGQVQMNNCIVDSNTAIGIHLREDTWDTGNNCKVRYNGLGISTGRTLGVPPNQRGIIRNNIIAYDSIGLFLSNNSDTIYCNSICSNKKYAIVYNAAGNYNSGITHNNFCTPDSASTEIIIYSAYDNPNVGLLKFMPLDTLCPPPFTITTPPLLVGSVSQQPVVVSPNPFSSQLTIESAKPFLDATITLTNLLGQSVYYATGINGQRFTLSRSGIKSGVYNLRITEAAGVRTARRIVVTD
jgi:hypothetical protein